MFGLFSGKKSPREIGEDIVVKSVAYLDPTTASVTNFVRTKLGRSLSNSEEIALGYAIALNSATLLTELSIDFLRNVNFDKNELRAGSRDVLDKLRQSGQTKVGHDIEFDFQRMSDATVFQLQNNSSFLSTRQFYGNGEKGSLFHKMTVEIIHRSAPYAFADADLDELYGDTYWNGMLQAFEGLDRSYRWICKSVPFHKMSSR
ncbi:MAG: hypothetical protein EWV41_00605 [Microcystis wesenbergii Mw_MB_S_20031200_S109]|nr:MAG: hypothetical protein EWV41_00605 [Microcystis wesenbergii Mw_MB_S_20031200_S109]